MAEENNNNDDSWIDDILKEDNNDEGDKGEKKEDSVEYVTKKDLEGIMSKIDTLISGKKEENKEGDKVGLEVVLDKIKQLENRFGDTENKISQDLKEQKINVMVDKFESKAREEYPFFKVDTLYLKYDMNMGLDLEEALKKQIAQEKERMERYAGTKKQEDRDKSKEGMPEDLRTFDNTLHTKKEFSKLSRTEKDEYWKKLNRVIRLKKE